MLFLFMNNKDQHFTKKVSIESLNAAKQRLIELEAIEREAKQLEKKVVLDSHFTDRHGRFMIAGETFFVLVTIGELGYRLIFSKPLGTLSFLSSLLSIYIAGSLIWRLDGWRQAKRNEKHLTRLKQQIEREQTEIGKVID